MTAKNRSVTPQDALLRVADLTTTYQSDAGPVHAVRGIGFTVGMGEVVALVGESGSGKSAAAMSVMGLIPERVGQVTGEVWFGGRNLLDLSQREMSSVRGRDISMVFQDPMTSLNPVITVGRQITDVIMRHTDRPRSVARKRCAEMLELVGLPDAERRMALYPHEFSGGMRQRAMIAMALSCEPSLLIADEPTTALDVTVQAQILELILDLRDRFDMSIVLITHDLGVVARTADRVMVMKDGLIVESGASGEVFYETQHDYTRRLLENVIDVRDLQADRDPAAGDATIAASTETAPADPVLEVEDLVVTYSTGRSSWLGRRTSMVRAVDGLSLRIEAGEILGLVGESGCGKSTLARSILDLVKPTQGRIDIAGVDPDEGSGKIMSVQMVFQDPYDSLDPRLRVGSIVAEPLAIRGGMTRSERVQHSGRVLEQVGLRSADAGRFPHQFSGGQRQRIGIARAISVDPELVICDEPVSALDVTVRGRILALFDRLQKDLGVALLFIAHDLGVVRAISDRVAVMYLGKIVETGPTDVIFDSPAHPYTQALISAIPVADPDYERQRERIVLHGDVPSPIDPPSGCRFRTRCHYVQPYCAEVEPPLSDIGGQLAACHFWREIRDGEIQPTPHRGVGVPVDLAGG